MHLSQGQDVECVYYSLLPRLEDCHGYKGCIPARDLQSDVPVVERVTSVVNDAACIIVILTPAFCQDESCKRLLDKFTRDRSCTVLPVMLEKCTLPQCLGHLKVIQYYSWELLLQAMEEVCGVARG